MMLFDLTYALSTFQGSARLTPVASPQGSALLVSDDGKTVFYNDGGVVRLDVRSGHKIGPEALRVADFGGSPRRIVARTTSQGLNATVGALPFEQSPQVYAAAIDAVHLLVTNKDIVVEFATSERRKEPNRTWFLPDGAALSAPQYGPPGTLEAWTWSRTESGLRFTAYTVSLGSRDREFRRKKSLDAQLPKGAGLRSVEVGGYDPKSGTYFLQIDGKEAKAILLVNRSGRVIGAMPRIQSNLGATPMLLVEWALRVRNAEVPGGKAAWEPLAFAGNRKFWLLQHLSDGKMFVWRR